MSIRVESRVATLPNGRWLTATRIIWLLTAVAVLLVLIPEVQATFAAVERLCAQPDCGTVQVTAQTERAFHSLGISLDAYAAYNVALSLIDVVVCYTLAATLMARRSTDRMVLLTAFACVLVCTPKLLSGLQAAGGSWTLPTHVLTTLGTISTGVLVYIFPTGRFVPRWTALLAAGWVGVQLLPNSAFSNNALADVPWFIFPTSILAIQIYRYRKLSTPVQRQQTKLIVLGFGIFACVFVIGTGLSLIDAKFATQVFPYLLVQTGFDLIPLPVFLSIGFAVLRYRLWDVDVFVSRTLVYLALTASLVLLYLGSVVSLQAIFRAISGQQSDLAIAISTLVIAALFNPLRRRIQELIARTFYRSKYDAAMVLSAFGATCRDETDLDRLRSGLTRVVEETLQPDHVSFWLPESSREG
ncbi:MAG: hypothetical protein ACR2JC_09250 [Chloroflexota bacterium]